MFFNDSNNSKTKEELIVDLSKDLNKSIIEYQPKYKNKEFDIPSYFFNSDKSAELSRDELRDVRAYLKQELDDTFSEIKKGYIDGSMTMQSFLLNIQELHDQINTKYTNALSYKKEINKELDIGDDDYPEDSEYNKVFDRYVPLNSHKQLVESDSKNLLCCLNEIQNHLNKYKHLIETAPAKVDKKRAVNK